jgi:hypothetical protein
VYLTGSTPFASQSPQTVTGDVTISSTAVTTIANNAVTTAKILDANVTTAKIADANVTVAKISATGTASATTYLRGDGAWATPSSGGSGAIGISATNTTTQSIPIGGAAVTPGTISFGTYSAGATGSFDGTTFTANAAGVYLITVSVATNNATNVAVRPGVAVGGTVIAWGSAAYGANYPSASTASGSVSVVYSLASGNQVTIVGANASTAAAATVTTDGTTRLTITKLF